ncbi:MAG TPA: transposase [Candidatus Saccharimonadaceae bacterium]|nr:transposase [Candidatus Saccharimonadaceae bacterium]
MSKKNTVRKFDVPAYYHVYNRGAGKQKIFPDARDKAKFMSLLARYLDPDDTSLRSDGLAYEKSAAHLVAYCLMGNHFHLLLYQDSNVDDIKHLLSAISTAYSMYFNLRYKRSGRLFEGPYRAVAIDSDTYLAHITRYIHLNPRTYRTYKWSSLPEYIGTRATTWVHPELVTATTREQYLDFLEDYTDRSALLKELKDELGI